MKITGSSFCYTLLLLVVGPVMLGCQQALDRPDFDPEYSATKALEQCDQNGDGHIDLDEAKAAPGIARAFVVWDADRDKLISREEFANRIAGYAAGAGSVTSAAFTVTYKKKPLAGAEITLEPEPFMGDGFESVTAATDQSGYVTLSNPQAQQSGYAGVYLGVYRVKISKQQGGKEILPARYNTESILGFDSGAQGRRLRMSPRFDLE